jgi:hypothetical protein
MCSTTQSYAQLIFTGLFSQRDFSNFFNEILCRNKTFSTFRGADIEEENLQNVDWIKDASNADLRKTHSEATTPSTKFISIQINPSEPPRKMNKFWQYFECIARRTFDDGKRLSAYYASPVKEPNILLELETSPKRTPTRCTRSLNVFAAPCPLLTLF